MVRIRQSWRAVAIVVAVLAVGTSSAFADPGNCPTRSPTRIVTAMKRFLTFYGYTHVRGSCDHVGTPYVKAWYVDCTFLASWLHSRPEPRLPKPVWFKNYKKGLRDGGWYAHGHFADGTVSLNYMTPETNRCPSGHYEPPTIQQELAALRARVHP
jgi:hypothetical protein